MATRKRPVRKRVPASGVSKKRVPEGSAPEPVDDSLDALRDAATGCKRCPLWKPATQTVFGEGPDNARILVVVEQPGDQEDLGGHPFVGPAGKLFDRALEELGVDRSRIYVTNAVKHSNFERRGKVRLHRSPNPAEQRACRLWLEGELAHPSRRRRLPRCDRRAQCLRHEVRPDETARYLAGAARWQPRLRHRASLVGAATARFRFAREGDAGLRRRPGTASRCVNAEIG